MVSSLTEFNAAPAAAAEVGVLSWCESKALADALTRGRPYPDAAALNAALDAAFDALTWDDILEAMSGHPRIGERAGGISAAEQAGAAAAGAATRRALAAGNLAYERRFGHVFLICASGLSGQEMLGRLQARLENTRTTERTVARQELRKITRLRMQKQLGL
ncbi:MAG TPA: 2-oxo-4-hydroxy-4-carboxy-5-ureidoimidazoline decarboxylase [Streptosporangiaceae bacterium]|nr:2-oxo-4-hydroxy-4-carboxy-5-ureidoimidazoline decarboxylase [Streptosporangiaceae bacterium]